jgi:hypothetical protein
MSFVDAQSNAKFTNTGHESNNEENSPTFNRRVSPLVAAATQESNVWVLSVKGRKKDK